MLSSLESLILLMPVSNVYGSVTKLGGRLIKDLACLTFQHILWVLNHHKHRYNVYTTGGDVNIAQSQTTVSTTHLLGKKPHILMFAFPATEIFHALLPSKLFLIN